jgi:hypothetical protein
MAVYGLVNEEVKTPYFYRVHSKRVKNKAKRKLERQNRKRGR